MKELTVIGLRMRVVDIPVVIFVVLAVLSPFGMGFLGGSEPTLQILVMDIWWGISLLFWIYLAVWILRFDGVRSPIWRWCPPFFVARNQEPVLRYGLMLLLCLGTVAAMTIYLVQRVQGKI